MDPKIAKNREDEYFARQEFERLQKLAQESEAKLKQQQMDEMKQMHWMRCPKDGMELVELEYMGVKVDKCTHCEGIFFDKGETEKILEANEKEEGLITKIMGVFS